MKAIHPFRSWKILCSLLAAAGAAICPPATAAAGSGGENVVIWHVPHPDDETLGMGWAIAESAEEGRRNIIVMYTAGERSVVRHGLNAAYLNALLAMPFADRPHPGRYLTKTSFGQARIAESRAALMVLGVQEEDVIYVGLPDGALSVIEALKVMRKLDELFPGAKHRSTSILDPHRDHQRLARALFRFAAEKEARGEPVGIAFYRVYGHEPIYSRTSAIARPVSDMERKREALAEFGVWRPEEGRFGVGARSVPALFARAASDPIEYEDVIPERLPWMYTRTYDLFLHLHLDRGSLGYFRNPAWTWEVGFTREPKAFDAAVRYYVWPDSYRFGAFLGMRFDLSRDWKTIRVLSGVSVLQHILLEFETTSQHNRTRAGLRLLL